MSLALTLTAGCGSGGVALRNSPAPTPFPLTIQTTLSQVAINGSAAFSASQQGKPSSGGQWLVLGGPQNGRIDATGNYVAPATVPNPALVWIEYSLEEQTASMAITVKDPDVTTPSSGSLQVQASSASVAVNGIDPLSVSQSGKTVVGGQWVVLGGAGNGAIDALGVYHAPSIVPSSSTVWIQYTLANQISTLALTVFDPSASSPAVGSLIVHSAQTSVAVNGVDPLSVTQAGTVVNEGQWVVLGGSSNGYMDTSGVYHAPASVPTPSTVFVGYVIADQIGTITLTIYDPAAIPPPALVSLQTARTSVSVNGSDLLSATQAGKPVNGGQWVVQGGSQNGSIDLSGIYHAPSTVPSPSTVTVGYVLAGNTTLIQLLITSPPVVLTVTPTVIKALISSIQISGSGFNPTSLVVVNAIPMRTTFLDSTHLSASVVLTHPLSGPLNLEVDNSDTGSSNTFLAKAQFPGITVTPATLSGGDVSLNITGSDFAVGDVALLNGRPLITTVTSSTQMTVTGYLAPWVNGSVDIEVASGGVSPISEQMVPIAATKVPYDAAARFSTQAAFGPRPDLVEHIQNIGFDAYIAEQFQQPPVFYDPSSGYLRDFLNAGTTGNSLLRQRVALGLQSIFVTHQQSFSPSFSNLETKLESDVTENFRQILDDIASDPSLTAFLNLPGNRTSTSTLDQPNQNFARELLQLFTLGPVLLNDDGTLQLDASGKSIPTYSQETVIDLTRALTGWIYPAPISATNTAWGVDFSQPLTTLESWHDQGAKTLFETVLLPSGQTTLQDRQIALDSIFNHPNLPPFISHLLIQRLVKSNPSSAYIQRISTVFEDDGKGVRGDMGAVVRAILLDPEARSGDLNPAPDDGFLQQPILFQLFIHNVLQDSFGDDQRVYLAGTLGEGMGNSPTIFYYFSPSYVVPGTNINSPEFMLLNNVSTIQRSQALWGILEGVIGGYTKSYQDTSWLFTKFNNVADFVEALNHQLYHGTMSSSQQASIISYCSGLNPFDRRSQFEAAVFLALNADSQQVSH